MNIFFKTKDNIYDVVDCIIENGVMIIDDTRTAISGYYERVEKCFEVYLDIELSKGYQNVEYNGNFYYIYDIKRFPNKEELKKIMIKIDIDEAKKEYL